MMMKMIMFKDVIRFKEGERETYNKLQRDREGVIQFDTKMFFSSSSAALNEWNEMITRFATRSCDSQTNNKQNSKL